MKFLLAFLAVLALGSCAPQPRKVFHEHFQDFVELIEEEVGDELERIFNQYLEFEEFLKTIDYIQTADFKNLVYEMESLPEFKAVVEFLENNNIDILYFIDLVNEALEQLVPRTRQQISGKDAKSLIADYIAVFPKSKLSDLFDQKMNEDETFRTAMENLKSDEWDSIWSALWENETFKAEVQILSDNGLELQSLLDEIMAIFGQN